MSPNASHQVMRDTRHIAYRMVGLQAIAGFLVSLLWLSHGWFGSALLGSVACVLPSFCFTKRLFATFSPGTVKKTVLIFFSGEFVKLLMSAIFLVVIIKWMPVSILACVTGYMGSQLGFWLTPLFIKLDR